MLDAVQPPAVKRYERPKARSRFRFGLAILMLILLAGGIFLGSRLVIIAQKIFEGEGRTLSFRQFFIAPDKPLRGEETGEIHLLLLGIGGEKHEGGTLTDTMILATLKLPTSKDTAPVVSLLSIPRDLAVYIPGYEYRKINSAYALGEADGKQQGPRLAVQTVEQLLQTTIPYYAVIDFQGFKKVVDDLGGVEIDVEVGFTDPRFPDDKNGYLPPITFEPGSQKMNGERALQFVRSRHGDNNQGTDFARAKRQQQILKTIKNRVEGLQILTNLSLVDRLLDDLANHIRTNLAPHELKRLYNLARDIKNENIKSLTIDHEGGLVCDQIVEDTKAYLLVPCAGPGNYEAIRNLFKNQFLVANLEKEQPIIEIQNASGIDFLGQRTQSFLNLPLLKITSSNYKGGAAYQETIIYDNTRGQKPETLKYLQGRLGGKIASSPFPFQTVTPNPDFVIVVTTDLEKKFP